MGSDLARDQGAYQIVVWVFEDQRRQITRQSFACRNPSLLGSCELVNFVQSLSPTTGNDSPEPLHRFRLLRARMGASGSKLITHLRRKRPGFSSQRSVHSCAAGSLPHNSREMAKDDDEINQNNTQRSGCVT
ncbi:hypothetical protein [Paraburkholderia sp. BR14262]|uniref:hypothetical protein n=1 Tax=Paraburkholderia sp. BR14262 TaxID=3236999 RepID=UPI0034CF4F7F